MSAAPTLLATLADRWQEAWLGSPAVADLDGDGENEIIAPRHDKLNVWHLDGTLVFQVTGSGRFYASPIVANLDASNATLEIAAASVDDLYVWDSSGQLLTGFPMTWLSEIRALAAHDIDGDDALEIVVVSTDNLNANGQRDIVMAYEIDGQAVTGYPPNTTGTAAATASASSSGASGRPWR